MNPFVMTATCEVCGGEGPATMETAGAQWKFGRHRYSTVQHSDPRVCATVLQRRRRELQRREDTLAEAEACW